MIHRSDSLSGNEGSRCATIVLERLTISVIWNGVGVALIWTPPRSAGNSNTKARTDLPDRPRKTFPDLKIASPMGDSRVHRRCLDALRAKKIRFIPRLRENQHVFREGYGTWTIADIARRPDKGRKMIVKGFCRLGQSAGARSPLVRLVVMLCLPANRRRSLAFYRQRWTLDPSTG